MRQVLNYVALKYTYYKVPFCIQSWGMVFSLAAFAATVNVYHNIDEERVALNAMHFTGSGNGQFIPLRDATPAHLTAYLSWFIIGYASLVTAWLFVKTIVAVSKNVRGS